MIKPRLASKHQRLIRQCYPGGRGVDKRANASELSYLLYYASTRRAKLTKVGAYLERLARHQVARSHSGSIQVTLEIAQNIIDKCPEDLNLFARNIVRILLDVLSTGDVSLCQHSVKVFHSYCAAHEKTLFGGDANYLKDFHALVRKYMDLAANTTGPNSQQWTQIGLDAAEDLASSEILNTRAGMPEIDVIIPLTLSTLHSSKHTLSDIAHRVDEDTHKYEPRASDVREDQRPEDLIENDNEADLGLGSSGSVAIDQSQTTALTTLKLLSDVTGVSQLRKAIKTIVWHELKEGPSVDWSSSLMIILTRWTPVHLRFYVVSSLVDELTHLSPRDYSIQLKMTKFISALLSSSVNMIGLSIIDILRSLLLHQHKIIKTNELEFKFDKNDVLIVKPHGIVVELVTALRDAISALATHVYYSEQVCDLVAELLARCCFSRSPVANGNNNDANDSAIGMPASVSNSSEIPASEVHELEKSRPNLIINDLEAVRRILTTASVNTTTISDLNNVRLLEWETTAILLNSNYLDVRRAYLFCWIEYMKSPFSDADKDAAKKDSGFVGQDALLQVGAGIVSSLGESSVVEETEINDVETIFKEFVKNYSVYGGAAVISSCYELYDRTNVEPVAELALRCIIFASTDFGLLELKNMTETALKQLENQRNGSELSKQNTKSNPELKKHTLSKTEFSSTLISQPIIKKLFDNPQYLPSSASHHTITNDSESVQNESNLQVQKTRSFNQLRFPGYATTIHSNNTPNGSDSASRHRHMNENGSLCVPHVRDLKRAASSLSRVSGLSDNRTRGTLSIASDDNDIDLNSFLNNLNIKNSVKSGQLGV